MFQLPVLKLSTNAEGGWDLILAQASAWSRIGPQCVRRTERKAHYAINENGLVRWGRVYYMSYSPNS